jgi:hypothetical protein
MASKKGRENRDSGREPPDEWVSLAEVLGLPANILAADTRGSRLLRRAVVRLSNPEVSAAELAAIRALIAAVGRDVED